MSFTLWAILFGLFCCIALMLAGFYFTTGRYVWAACYMLYGIFCIYTVYDIGREAGRDELDAQIAAHGGKRK